MLKHETTQCTGHKEILWACLSETVETAGRIIMVLHFANGCSHQTIKSIVVFYDFRCRVAQINT